MSTQLDEATQNWEQLTELLERFIEAWEKNPTPPNPREYLPQASGALIAFAANELIKIDMENRLRVRDTWPLERYFELFPEVLDNGKPPCDLVYEEFHLQKQAGENPDPQTYFQRFPQNEVSLRRLLHCPDLHHSTSLARRMPTRSFEVGEKVDEFVLITQLGSGAFGQVFLARQVSMQRLVALKITTNRSNEPETLAQLEHPGIVRVYDQRHWADGNLWLLYMQFAAGGTLREVIDRVRRTPFSERDGQLLLESVDAGVERSGYTASESESMRRRLKTSSWAEVVCRIGMQLAMALDYAHRRGVLHRDVKPANVLLTADCQPKLADFNISFASELEGVNADAFFGGSLAYMSPEQLEAFNPECDTKPDSLDGRADLFSLAAMLWELLYGQRPFREDGLPVHRNRMLEQLVHYRRNEPPKIPASVGDPLQRQLTETLKVALRPDRNQRPVDGATFARSLWLCMEPKSRSLIEIPSIGWRNLVRNWPMVATILVVLLPNGLAGLFNFLYNRGQIAENGAVALQIFERVSLVLNAIYFSLGAVLAKVIIGPIAKAVKESDREHLKPDEAIALRLKSLRLGTIASTIGIFLWLSSGIVFPVSLQWMAPNIQFYHYYHFLASMTVCGLIAAAYPFFGLTFLVIRVFYPALLRVTPGTERDEEQLNRLEYRLFTYLFLAAIVPLVSMLPVVTLGIQDRYVSIGLIVSGLLGLALVYVLYQRIRDDIASLRITVRPFDGTNAESHSLTNR